MPIPATCVARGRERKSARQQRSSVNRRGRGTATVRTAGATIQTARRRWVSARAVSASISQLGGCVWVEVWKTGSSAAGRRCSARSCAGWTSLIEAGCSAKAAAKAERPRSWARLASRMMRPNRMESQFQRSTSAGLRNSRKPVYLLRVERIVSTPVV